MGVLRRIRLRGRIRPAGYIFHLIAFLVLLAAFNTGTNLLYLLMGGVISLILISIFLAGFNLRKVTGKCEAPPYAERGSPFYVQVRVENRKRLFPAIGLRLERAADASRDLGYVLKLPAQRAGRLQIEEQFHRRGAHRLPEYRIASGFPFGLFDRFQSIESQVEVLVHPRIRTVRTVAFAQQSGARYLARQASGDGDEYFGLREYQPGDDMRHIAWRISARMGEWMIREWARDNSRFVIFALDTAMDGDVEDFEARFEDAVELTASLAVTMLHRHYSVGIACGGKIIEPAEGTSQERRILDWLARIEAAPKDSNVFGETLGDLDSRRATIVCLTPNPTRWGRRLGTTTRYLDPREVVHA